MKIINNILPILSLIIVMNLVACDGVEPVAKGKLFYLFDGKSKGLDTLINLNGYFSTDKMHISNCNVMFYSDGTFATIFGAKWNNNESYLIGNTEAWGIYIIENNIIKAQALWVQGGIDSNTYFTVAPTVFLERWFKIISKDTLEDIYYVQYDNQYKNPRYLPDIIGKRMSFHPLKTRPDSNLCWFKRYPWAWKDGKIIK